MKKIREKKNALITILLLAVIAYIVLVRTFAASYSVFVADDFSNAIYIETYRVPFFEFVGACFGFISFAFMNWGGSYFSLVLQSFLSPINNFGFHQLRVVMALNTMLFLFSVALLVWTLLRKTGKDALNIRLSIIAMALFVFSDMDAYAENFFWFTGAAGYTVPVSFVLIGLSFLIRTEDFGKKRTLVAAAIFGGLGMGGSLAVTGAGCYAAFLICVYMFLEKKKFPLRQGIVFGVWLICAIINTAAPGNYARQGDDGAGLMRVVEYAVEVVGIRWLSLFEVMNIACLVFLVMICGFVAGKKAIRVNAARIWVGLLAFLMPVVSAFPVSLGYNAGYFPNRCLFVLDVTIFLSMGSMAFVMGTALSGWLEEAQHKMACMMLACFAVACVMLDGYGITSSTLRRMAIQLRDGTYRTHYVECKQFMESLEAYEDGSDVQITQEEYPDAIAYAHNFVLYEDPAHWVNYSIAKWYGLNSIALLPGG